MHTSACTCQDASKVQGSPVMRCWLMLLVVISLSLSWTGSKSQKFIAGGSYYKALARPAKFDCSDESKDALRIKAHPMPLVSSKKYQLGALNRGIPNNIGVQHVDSVRWSSATTTIDLQLTTTIMVANATSTTLRSVLFTTIGC